MVVSIIVAIHSLACAFAPVSLSLYTHICVYFLFICSYVVVNYTFILACLSFLKWFVSRLSKWCASLQKSEYIYLCMYLKNIYTYPNGHTKMLWSTLWSNTKCVCVCRAREKVCAQVCGTLLKSPMAGQIRQNFCEQPTIIFLPLSLLRLLLLFLMMLWAFHKMFSQRNFFFLLPCVSVSIIYDDLIIQCD